MKKPKSKALAIIPKDEPTLQVLGKKFQALIDGIDRQIEIDQHGEPTLISQEFLESETSEALAHLISGDSIALRDDFASLLKRGESEVEFLRDQGKQRYSAAKHLEHFLEKAKFTLKLFMEMKGIREVQGWAHRFVVQKNPASVFILDEQQIPEEFMSFKPMPDKEKIKEALLAGKVVPGCVLRADSTSLRIK